MNRRQFLQLAAATSASLLVPHSRVWAFSNGNDDPYSKKLIVVLLRGGMDGLNVVVPYADATYQQIRPKIALQKPGDQRGVLDLDGYFGLHPALAPLMPFWQERSLAFVHAAGSPDSTRSHFDAQDYMESGVPGLKNINTGWLNRLVQELPTRKSPVQAVSIGPILPRIMSGPANIATVAQEAKTRKMAVDRPAIGSAFEQLYSGRKDELSHVYSEGMAAHKEVADAMQKAEAEQNDPMSREQMIANKGAPLPKNFNYFGKQISALFRHDPSVQVAFVDFGGWDTHINEGSAQGQLANHLTPLGAGLADLINGLGPMYKNTQIIVMSEFGRTAKENGNGGTDHGHGNVMWLLGKDVAGGKVYGRWAGLTPGALHEQRDLPTSTDFRTVISSLIGDHLSLSRQQMAKVFPDFQNSGDPFVRA
ncbi:MAG TPA: DUF1501 domain-containing protein [Oculatellaceae cyanobacterium]